MIVQGAVFPYFHSTSDDGCMVIVTTQVSNSKHPNNKKLSISKWSAKYLSSRDELEAKIHEFCSSHGKAQNLLWEQEANLRLETAVATDYLIIWIESENERKIQKSFLHVARQLGIFHSGDERNPSLISRVYHYCQPHNPNNFGFSFHRTLFIFDSLKPEGLRITDYLPPIDLPNDSSPSILFTSDAAKPWTRFMELPDFELEKFISQVIQLRYPGREQIEFPQEKFLTCIAALDTGMFTNLAEDNHPDAFKTEVLKAVHRFLDERLHETGTIESTPNSQVIINGKPSWTQVEPGYPGDLITDALKNKSATLVPQSPHVPEIHNFFQTRRQAEFFWDKTLFFSGETARKSVREYVQLYNNCYGAVVQIDCQNVNSLKDGFFQIGRDLGFASTDQDFHIVDPKFTARIYEYFDQSFHGNVLFVFYCILIHEGSYDGIRTILDYLPVIPSHPNGHCPFTLICSDAYNGMIKQPFTDSQAFRDDDLSQIERSGRGAEPTFTEMNGFPLAKALFTYKLRRISEPKTWSLLHAEVHNAHVQYQQRITDYDLEKLLLLHISAASVGERMEAVIWMRLINHLLSLDLGRDAITLLRNISLVSETLHDSSSVSASPVKAFAVDLRLNLVGPEFKDNFEQMLRVLGRCSFIRYLESGVDGTLTVKVPTLLQKLARLAPCDLLKSEVNSTLLSLAQVGQVHLTLNQMHSLQRQIYKLANDSFARLSQISLNAEKADPFFQKIYSSHREKLEEELSRFSTCRSNSHQRVMITKAGSITYENIGIKAGGNVDAGKEMSAFVGFSNDHDVAATDSDEWNLKFAASSGLPRKRRRLMSDPYPAGSDSNVTVLNSWAQSLVQRLQNLPSEQLATAVGNIERETTAAICKSLFSVRK